VTAWTYLFRPVNIRCAYPGAALEPSKNEPFVRPDRTMHAIEYGLGLPKHAYMGKSTANHTEMERHRFRAPISANSARSKSQIVRRVCEALELEYGRPRHGNPKDPLDDLISIMLSNKTGPAMAGTVYRELKTRFDTWDDVLSRPASTLERMLRPAGLSRIRSSQIRSTLKRIRSDFTSCNLDGLRKLSPSEAQSYLTSLAGVSDKVAKCVLMYTCGAEVLPVDSHVHRVATRLGWTVRKRADQCHEELEALVPPYRRYAFHVDCVAHGRLVCRPANPSCSTCCVKRYCYYYQHEVR